MPAPPEILNVQRQIRRVEILRDPDVHDPRRADGHVRISREVKIELNRIAQACCPCRQARQACGIGKTLIGPNSKGICDRNLLEQPESQEKEACIDVFPIQKGVLEPRELGHHVPMMDNRSGDELGKESDKQGVVEKIIFFGLAMIAVHQVSDLLECEKADAQGQRDSRHRNGSTQHCVHVLHKEIRILEIPKQGDVEDDAKNQHSSAVQDGVIFQIFCDAPELSGKIHSKYVVHQNGGKNDGEKRKLPVGIKEK